MVYAVEDLAQITKKVTYGLLKNIGNKNFWKTSFRYKKWCVYLLCQKLGALVGESANRNLIQIVIIWAVAACSLVGVY
jgi:hypothetical protein